MAEDPQTLFAELDDFIQAESHEEALNLVDTSTASKTLVTTRIRGLGGGSQVGAYPLESVVEGDEELVVLLHQGV